MSEPAVVQLSLFDDPAAPLPAESAYDSSTIEGLAWSYSRRGTSEQCPRRYYNLYYGANQRTAKDEPAKVRLHFLKDLGNRYTRTGDLLHLAIRTYFNKARAGTFMDAHQLIRFAQRIFEADLSFSRTYPDGNTSNNGKYPPSCCGNTTTARLMLTHCA